MFDSLFFNVFKHYKNVKNKKANQIATIYISIFQCSILLLLGMFFAGFFSQMDVNTLSQDKAWILFIMASVFIFFKNWIQYAGRKSKILHAKMINKKSQNQSIFMLWLFPVVCCILAAIIWQAV
ncbi:hypothetical protein ES674_03825 [Bizionia myxarmorum]|uniref:Uncharacterized protein n=1 Tax=Bizionia myxarmorum TaxID=291186 RepID=A0A5D0RE78_9FLAO|nr:hypothetical protein ES674_03825 [Bizionia myxarmorum]